MKKEPCALLYGSSSFAIDHIAPLCIALKIPLITTDSSAAALAERFYPQLLAYTVSPHELAKKLLDETDWIVTHHPPSLIQSILQVEAFQRNISVRLIWYPLLTMSPHHEPFDGIILVPGPYHEQLFQKAYPELHRPHIVSVGNLSLQLYSTMKKHFSSLLPPELCFEKHARTILYIPQMLEDHSIVDQVLELCKDLPTELQLLIYISPLFEERFFDTVEKLEELTEGNSALLLVKQFPPLCALLDYADAILSGPSLAQLLSLSYNKPLLFLEEEGSAKPPLQFLLQCGEKVSLSDRSHFIEALHDPQIEFKELRHMFFQSVFSAALEPSELKSRIITKCKELSLHESQ